MIKIKTGEFLNCCYPELDEYPFLTAVSSTLKSPFGELEGIRSDRDLEEHLVKIENQWLQELNIRQENVVSIKQVHGNGIHCAEIGGFAGEFDGLFTDRKGVFLRVITADCIPVFIFDTRKMITGLIHAGWRSLEKGILTNAIKIAVDSYGSDPGDLIAALGPHIHQCCYEVGSEVADLFSEEYSSKKENGKYMLSIGKAAQNELVKAGLKPENIESECECTLCNPETYFSARGGRFGKGRLIHITGIRTADRYN